MDVPQGGVLCSLFFNIYLSTSWSMNKEIIVIRNVRFGLLLLNFVALVWVWFLSDMQWRSLRMALNNALPIATGCVKITRVDYFHKEAGKKCVTDGPNHQALMENLLLRHIRRNFVAFAQTFRTSLYPNNSQ